MSIELHCDHCNKLIRAPDDTGGQRGKCPYCNQSVYIPIPVSDDDVIPLAPVDEEEEHRAEQLRRESLQYAAAVDHETGTRPGAGAAPGASSPPIPGEIIDVPAEVSRYVISMSESKLDAAEKIAAKLKHTGTRARDYVQGLLVDQMPLSINNLPEPLVKGFLKKLLETFG